ncbi:MAG: hypothetical protein MUO88_07840 [Desulfobacterales bacterium]|nr:hypothetical protein [Desulfobacterales bacterium]
MSATVDALYFRSHSIRVRQTFYSVWDLIIKAWPSTICFKLVFRTVQPCSATLANVGAKIPKVIVFASEGNFSAFMIYDLFLFRG